MLNRELTSVRIGPKTGLVGRLVVATTLFYAVAVLYFGTTGAVGRDVFVQPMVLTAVFAGVLCVPLIAGWVVVRRFTDN
ncbi:hypothetical protein [Gordonia hydrophobica]|uniref:Uncharacterized protein n=1 Tax=Gordonia hydrophobica TaxID=40516 RepID=A0ABZ2U515_9ACTN|nr:hypothetical protein [Gordonia hydrophobica]MBM7368113.1 hypothetical protein [Gordonia hydrophobica]